MMNLGAATWSVRAWLMSGVVATALALAVAAMTGSGSAGAAPQREPVKVQIIGVGSLLEGDALEVRAMIRCQPVGEVLEALVTASQDENAIEGEGFFGSGVICDGRPRTLSARIQPFDEQPFHRGRAHVSAFVLLSDEESGDFSGQDTRTIQVR
jgi:hypothetical protein